LFNLQIKKKIRKYGKEIGEKSGKLSTRKNRNFHIVSIDVMVIW